MDPLEHTTRSHTAISDRPLSVDEAIAFIADPRAGATVTFTGLVRNHALDDAQADDAQADGAQSMDAQAEGAVPDGTAPTVRPVTGLDYEAYTEVAERRLEELATEVAAKWPDLCATWAVHRVGRLEVGEAAVVVAVSSPHRDTAFDAGRYLIDTLKATVPIWKKEHWADGGSHWPGTD